MITVYCYPRCSTCKKALKYLDEHHVKYELLDIQKQNPNEEQLKQWHHMSGLPLKRFFNTSGLIYKNNHLKEAIPTMSEEQQYNLLATDGLLVKRPLVIGEDFVLTGFKEEEWKKLTQ